MKRPAMLISFLAGAAMVIVAAGVAGTALASATVGDHQGVQASQDQDKAQRGFLGMALAPLTDAVAQKLGITKQDGLAVLQVVPDGPAAKAGIQAKDVVTALNNTAVKDMKALRDVLQNVKPNDVVQVTYSRNGQSQTVAVTAGTEPQRPNKAGGNGNGNKGRPNIKLPEPGLGLGGVPGVDLSGVPADQRFDHMLSSQTKIKDASGAVVTITTTYGKVVSASDTSLQITTNEGPAATYQITSNTKVRGKIGDLKAGDKVVVVTKNNSTEAVIVMSAMTKHVRPKTTQGTAENLPSLQGLMERFQDIRGAAQAELGPSGFTY